MTETETKLDFSRNLLILGNLTILAWILLGFFATRFYNELAAWVLLLFNAFMVFGILRRLGCSSCYNCKNCTSGFGRIAGAFFGTGTIKEGSVGNRKALIGFVYVLLTVLPAGLLVASLIQDFAVTKILILICICAVTIFSLLTWLKIKKA
jgi:hypothetical protein